MSDQPKNPCSECPFRKKSLKGYVGPHDSAGEIIEGLRAGLKFPCHMQVNQITDHLMDKLGKEEDGPLAMTKEQAVQQAAREASHCTGALIMMNNACMISRNTRIAAMQDQVGKSDQVFANEPEMEAYHDDEKSADIRRKIAEGAGRVSGRKQSVAKARRTAKVRKA